MDMPNLHFKAYHKKVSASKARLHREPPKAAGYIPSFSCS